MERVICLVIGYCFGLFQTAFIYGKINHIDIRKVGSGNAGTTNALRVLGKKAGIIVFVGDVSKVILATVVTRLIFGDIYPENITLLILYTGLGAVLGHNYPCYLNFKGGKGIAATSGLIISLLNWQMIVVGLVVFFTTAIVTRYVSAGSLVLMVAEFAAFVLFTYLGYIGGLGSYAIVIEATIVFFAFTVFAWVRHRSNIVRLWHGEEKALF